MSAQTSPTSYLSHTRLNSASGSVPAAGAQKALEGRNLVLTVDGTSNKFGSYNTNVIELYSRLEASDKQLNYYNSGVGTITKPKWGWKWVAQNFDSAIDLAIAWNFDKVIMAAYRWLSERYKPGDRIFLFGFSRGAYQMRVLAAMIEKVGLIQEGNVEQIPFAFELYKTKNNDRKASRFKDTFSMKDVRVHFLGVWDTVSSVGLVGNKILPMTDEWRHINIFRHALALDERRVKFIPECVMRKEHVHHDQEKKPVNFDEEYIKIFTTSGERIKLRRLKEVWFAGSHSDVGGGHLSNDGLNLESAPLLWMVNEAALAGLLLRQSTVEWKVRDLETAKPHRSLHTFWWALEGLPLHRQSRSSRSGTSSRVHHAKSRAIYPGQKIHASVAFKNTRYHPKAKFYPTRGALRKLKKSREDALPEWSQLVAEGPSGTFRDAEDWKPRLEMDLFDLEAPSRAFLLLLGVLSDSNTLQILNRLGFLASLEGGAGAILSKDKNKADGDDKDDDNKDNDISRRLTLKRLLGRKEPVFLATVKLLARLATAPGQEANRLKIESLLLSHSSGAESSSQSGLVPAVETSPAGKAVEGALLRDHDREKSQIPETRKGITGRIVHCLGLDEPIRSEAINTIIEIAPIGDLRKQLHHLGVIEKLVKMLSGNDATVATPSANALVALARYDLAWQTTFNLVLNNEPNFNSRLRVPDEGFDDTRDAAAIIIADLVDYLAKSQTTGKPFAPSGITSKPLDIIINEETITLLNDMLVNEERSDESAADPLTKQTLSDSAADALAKLSSHAKFRDLIIDNAAPALVTMLGNHSDSAAKALAALIITHTGSNNAHDVQRVILGYERNIPKIEIGVTSKTETLLIAIVDMLKDRSRSSAAIILTELILDPAAARIIVESIAPNTLLESLNKRDIDMAHFSAEDYEEYGSLVQCLAATVKTHTRLRLKAKDANNRPLELSLFLQENGARLLFGLMGKNSPKCRAAADALVALTEHDHDSATNAHRNEHVLNNVLGGQYDEFLENLGIKLEQINDTDTPPANLSKLASDVASMIMALAVLGHANAKQLVVVFRLLHDLWLKTFDARTSSPGNSNHGDNHDNIENEKHEDDENQDAPKGDAYGEQADLVADAIAKAVRHSSRTVRKQFSEHCEADSEEEADPKQLVALLVQRLGGQSQHGTWKAIKQLANSARTNDEYEEDDCRKAVSNNPDLLPTLVWLSRRGNKRQNIFASKCLEDLLELGIGVRHQLTKGRMGKIRKVCKKMLL